jgi:drug/metabolite transporter (DMT)-like permease
VLGVLYAALGAFTFALNNVAMRRGVVTGSVLQGMALTVPIGGISFLVMTIAFGELGQLVMFPTAAFSWLACQGVVHFVIGRYCNYKSNQLMGVNLTAPVVQLQVPFAMMLAVVTLHEKFTVLQAIGAALMLGGSFITQGNAGKDKTASTPPRAATAIPTLPSQGEFAAPERKPRLAFQPRVFSGYVFGLAAAMCYGSSPLMARQAFLHAPGASTAAGGCLAYTAATLFLADPAQARRLARHQVHEARKPAVVPVLGRVGRRLPGLRLRLACRSAADGGDAHPPALSGVPAVPVAIDQPRLRGDELRRPHRRVHGGPGFDPSLARHR